MRCALECRRVPLLLRDGWLTYLGHNHAYRGGRGPVEPEVLAEEGDRVLLATPHAVILTDPGRSRHAWIFVSVGGAKLRWPSVVRARFDEDHAVISLEHRGLAETSAGEVRVDLTSGTVEPDLARTFVAARHWRR